MRVLLLALAFASPASAQYPTYQPADLSHSDSVSLYRTSMLAADSVGLIRRDQVLFLRDVTTEWDFVPAMSQGILDELATTFPNLQWFPDDFLQCPPGVEARFPGQSCPTKDDGYAVRFVRVSEEGPTSVAVEISIMTGGHREGWLGILSRTEEGWKLMSFERTAIT